MGSQTDGFRSENVFSVMCTECYFFRDLTVNRMSILINFTTGAVGNVAGWGRREEGEAFPYLVMIREKQNISRKLGLRGHHEN